MNNISSIHLLPLGLQNQALKFLFLKTGAKGIVVLTAHYDCCCFFCLVIMILMLDVSGLSKLLLNVFFLKVWFRSSRSELFCRKAWCKDGTRNPGPWTAGPCDPSQSLKVGPPSGTSPFFNEFFLFFKIFYLFLSFFSSFLNNKHEISSYLVS